MQVTVIRVGHALVKGTRGEAGGAPSKNSVWGVAKVGSALVTFSGRVGGTLRFKARHASMQEAMLQLFADKCAGKGMDYSYVDVTDKFDTVYEGLEKRILSDYKAAKAADAINVRDAHVKAEAPKVETKTKAETKAKAKPAAEAKAKTKPKGKSVAKASADGDVKDTAQKETAKSEDPQTEAAM